MDAMISATITDTAIAITAAKTATLKLKVMAPFVRNE